MWRYCSVQWSRLWRNIYKQICWNVRRECSISRLLIVRHCHLQTLPFLPLYNNYAYRWNMTWSTWTGRGAYTCFAKSKAARSLGRKAGKQTDRTNPRTNPQKSRNFAPLRFAGFFFLHLVANHCTRTCIIHLSSANFRCYPKIYLQPILPLKFPFFSLKIHQIRCLGVLGLLTFTPGIPAFPWIPGFPTAPWETESVGIKLEKMQNWRD